MDKEPSFFQKMILKGHLEICRYLPPRPSCPPTLDDSLFKKNRLLFSLCVSGRSGSWVILFSNLIHVACVTPETRRLLSLQFSRLSPPSLPMSRFSPLDYRLHFYVFRNPSLPSPMLPSRPFSPLVFQAPFTRLAPSPHAALLPSPPVLPATLIPCPPCPQGKARQGKARQGKARRGKARQDKAK